MMRFKRKGNVYQVITPQTTLEELEAFFFGGEGEGEIDANGVRKVLRDFAVVTDEERRFVVGVATVGDLEEFVKRRPG